MYLYTACDLLYYHAWPTLHGHLASWFSTQPLGPLTSRIRRFSVYLDLLLPGEWV